MPVQRVAEGHVPFRRVTHRVPVGGRFICCRAKLPLPVVHSDPGFPTNISATWLRGVLSLQLSSWF